MNNLTRKEFLKVTLAGTGAMVLGGCATTPPPGPAPLAAAIAPGGSPNGDVRVAVVGINAQGAGHVRTYYNMPGAKLVALCDADGDVLAKRVKETEAKNIKVTAYRDYRKLLEDKNIDAVVIATPNHWHSLMTIWALQAGKDVYVEKPMSNNIWEGRQAVEAAKRYSNRIVQAGTQGRSSEDIKEAIQYLRAGKLGKIQWARGLCYKLRESIGRTTGPQPVPPSVDYDLWTGPATLTPPRRNGAKGPIHYDWHWFWNYGGGDISNQGIHQMDTARWMLGEPGLPPTVMSIGGRFGYQDDAETPNTEICVYGYEKAPLIFEVRGLPMTPGMKAMAPYRGSRVGVIVQCESGYVQVTESGNATIYDNDNKKVQAFANGGPEEHRRNFIDAVRARKQEIANGKIENCHLSTVLCHLGNISYLVGAEKSNEAVAESIKSSAPAQEAFGRMLEHLKANAVDVASTNTVIGPLLKVDGVKERFTGSEKEIVAAANKCPLLKRTGRAPFVVPDMQRAT